MLHLLADFNPIEIKPDYHPIVGGYGVIPLTERKEFPGTLHGYQWVVRDVVAEKKLNAPEKLKKAKPGLQIMDELEALAEEAKAKGGAQFLDEDDINSRLKWMGLFHRAKQAPGTFMWRFKCPNGKFSLKQWKVLNDQVREYFDGEKDLWKPGGCYSLTTRQNVQLFGIRLVASKQWDHPFPCCIEHQHCGVCCFVAYQWSKPAINQ